MAYYQSNEPYNQDGVGAGLFWGGALGGLGYQATKHGRMSQIGTKHDGLMDKVTRNIVDTEGYRKSQNAGWQTIADNVKDFDKTKSYKVFGRGRNRAIAGGLSVLAGGLMGAGMDAAND